MIGFVKRFFSRLNKVQNKIIFPFFLVMILMGSFIIYIMTNLVSNNLEDRVNEKLHNDVRLLQTMVTDMEKSLTFYAQFIADTEKMASHAADARDSRLMLIYLLGFLKENRVSSNIGGLDELSEGSGLGRLASLGIRMTGLMVRNRGSRTTLSLSAVAPMEDHFGKRSVVTVYRDIDQDFLTGLQKKIASHRLQIYYRGKLIASSEVHKDCDLELSRFITPQLMNRVLDKEEPFLSHFKCGDHNVKMILSPLTVNFKKELLVAIFESTDDLVLAKSDIIITTCAIVIGLMLVIIPIFILIITRTVGPIRKLSEASRRIAEGDLEQYITVKTRDEVGELSESFNKMVADLKSSRRAIELLNQTLEERVAKRGEQLAETQSKLIQSEKLATVGEFAAGIAHELSNPLAGIYAFMQIFSKTINSRSLGELSESESRQFQENLVYVEREIKRCKSIIGNLLTFARVSEKKFVYVDINMIIEDILSFTKANLKKGGIRLEKNFDVNLPLVNSDPNELRQVFINLLINARKALPDGGELEITTKVVAEGEAVSIGFADTGIGIEDAIRDKIFDPFFTTRKTGEGTGLGLSISYSIIQDHAGEIMVDSEVGVGSTFTVILPVAGREVSVKSK
ncbi:MAG: HAMP domain-containing protein [Deltaproteobacteria bacterium]|nr:HAMP domain-containing protein [Candidatus Tharpella aukensis]